MEKNLEQHISRERNPFHSHATKLFAFWHFSRTTEIVLLYFWDKILVMQVPSHNIDCIRKVFIVPKYYVRISGWAQKYYEYNWIKTCYLYLSGLASKRLDIIPSYKLSSILVRETPELAEAWFIFVFSLISDFM